MLSLRALAALFFCAAAVPAQESSGRVVLYAETVTQVTVDRTKSADLWVTLNDLRKATGWEVKPEGVCSAKECIPIPADRKQEFLVERDGATWFNLSAFAKVLRQPVAHDAGQTAWSFGPRPEVQGAYRTSFAAPDFVLPDHQGKERRLSEFRGKKVLLITWATW